MLSGHFVGVQRYVPAGRLYHQAVSIEGKVYMWGGAGSSSPKAIEVFDNCTETWEQYWTAGVPHPGVNSVACTTSEGHVYAYGGDDGTVCCAVLSKLDVNTLRWSLLSSKDPSGPMGKWECGLVCFHGYLLTVFGGYGRSNNPIQPGSKFIKDEGYGTGWTNELHIFDLRKDRCVWYSPSVRGTRPPPCRNFTFTSINKHQALLYGGYLPEGKQRVSDLYLFDFSDSETMEIIKLEPKKGDNWPVGRACHAACCLGYGSNKPALFVIGGGTTDERILQDTWIFDVASRLWQELTLPRRTFPRCFHVATSTTLFPGYEEVTVFGGSSSPAFGVSISVDIPKLANTTLLTFEKSVDMKWEITALINDTGLGTFQTIQDKLIKICVLSRKALTERESSEKQLVIESDMSQLPEIVAKTVEAEVLSQANERAQVAEKRSHDLEQRAHDAEQRLHYAELRATVAERHLHSAEQRAMEAIRRAQQAKAWMFQGRDTAEEETQNHGRKKGRYMN